MHIMEGFLPWQWCVVWWIIALPCLILGAWQLKKVMDQDREALPLLGVTGGFIFILSSLKLPSVTGSCSHPTGTGLSAICFGPWITSVICAIVLLFQSLFLAHGGLSVLGANIVSMGIIGPLVGYAIYRVLKDTSVNIFLTVFLATALADLSTYIVTSLELALAFPAEVGGSGERWKRQQEAADEERSKLPGRCSPGDHLFRHGVHRSAPCILYPEGRGGPWV